MPQEPTVEERIEAFEFCLAEMAETIRIIKQDIRRLEGVDVDNEWKED